MNSEGTCQCTVEDTSKQYPLRHKELLKELTDVYDWFTLGMHLCVPLPELRKIECQHSQLNRRKIELLDAWFQHDERPCWRTFGDAISLLTGHKSQGALLANRCTARPTALELCPDRPEDGSRPTIPQHVRPILPRDGSSGVCVAAPSIGNSVIKSSALLQIEHNQQISLPKPFLTHHRPFLDRHPLSQGETIVDAASSVGVGHSVASKVFSIDRQQLRIPKSDPMSFMPYNPIPNVLQSPWQQQPVEQVVPNVQNHEWIAQSELERLYMDFQDLVVQIKEMMVEAKVAGGKIKEYLDEMVCGCGIPNRYVTLRNELATLPVNATVEEVFRVLLKFLHYDNSHLLRCLVRKFLPGVTASDLVAKYEGEFKNFQTWCPLGVLANAHQKVFPPSAHHLSNTSVSVHLNGEWQHLPYSHLEAFKRREFEQYISEHPFHMVHLEKRSIFVIWETSCTVINELSHTCRERFSHLRSLGVLQLIIGKTELDFTNENLVVYRLEPVSSNVECVSLSTSLASMQSELSHLTHESCKTKKSQGVDSGCYSSADTISIASTLKGTPLTATIGLPPYPLSDRVLEKYPFIEVRLNYQSNDKFCLNVKKGEKVRVLCDNDGKKYVVNEKKQYGYVPSTVLVQRPPALTEFKTSSPTMSRHSAGSPISFKDTASTDDSQSLCSNYSALNNTPVQAVDIIRHEIYASSDVYKSHHHTSPDTPSETCRPDTPPLVAQMEALEVCLSEDRNRVMEEEQLKPVPKKRLRLNLIKSIDESKSLTKSLHQDLEKLKQDEEISPTILQRLKKFIQRPRTRGDSVSMKTAMSVGKSQKLSPTIEEYSSVLHAPEGYVSDNSAQVIALLSPSHNSVKVEV